VLDVVLFTIGIFLGRFWDEVYELKNKVSKPPKPIPKSGVTMGSYAVPQSSDSWEPRRNVVVPKSPQQVEHERTQKMINQDIIERGLHPWE
jgi:hypothetical protein